MSVKLSGPMLPPSSGGMPRQVVVLLHGYGADGNDLIALGMQWRGQLPDALFVAPNAPQPCAVGPFGYQWFALDLDAPHLWAEGAAVARETLLAFLTELWRQTGLSARNTILAGFSQGAMMALNVGLSLPEAPLGIVAFSGALIAPEGFEQGQWARPPVCLVHGVDDGVVPMEASVAAHGRLEALGYLSVFHASPSTGHGISPDGLAFASDFIARLMASHH